MSEHERIPRRFFVDGCTCGGQYIGGECSGCGRVDVEEVQHD